MRSLLLLTLVAGAVAQNLPLGLNCAVTTSQTAASTTISAVQALATAPYGWTYPYALQSAANGTYVTLTGIITASAGGKGLGYTSTANYAWLGAPGSTQTAGNGVTLYVTSGLQNSFNRGDQVTVTGWVLRDGNANTIVEVCSFVSAGPNLPLAASYPLVVTTAMFTNPTDIPLHKYGAVSSTITNTTGSQRIGGWMTASTKPYQGMLVTLQNATVLPCNNTITMLPSGAGKALSYYSICQPTTTPLLDAYTRLPAGCMLSPPTCTTQVCQSCAWDKYSSFWISTDGGATGIAVSAQIFRTFNTYTVNGGVTPWANANALGSAGSPISAQTQQAPTTFTNITGILDYQVISTGSALTYWPQGTWTLIPRDQYDVVGGTPIPASSLPTAVIGTIKQQTGQWYSPNSDGSGTPAYFPPELLGPNDVINPSTGLYGTGDYFGYNAVAGQKLPGPDWNGCVNASALEWVYSGGYAGGTGNSRQNLCSCYPPNYYHPGLGANGAGTTYLQVNGIVSMIEGVLSGSGVGSFYLENTNPAQPNHALFVYQDGSAGKTVTLGDNITIIATAYSYYGLVEMQNTLSVVVNSHGNAVSSPIVLPSLQVLDVATNGHCSANTILYRANRITIQYVTVTKVFMYEPFPPGLTYWYNYTQVPLYSAAFNASIGKTYSGQGGNWYGMNNCADAYGNTMVHPLTGKPFICGFEITDQYGYKAIVDQCPYSSNGGLRAAFLGLDGVSTPLKVGDTFTSVSGVLKYQRGSYGADGAGGYLSICALMDPTGSYMAGRNQPWPSMVPSPPPSLAAGYTVVQSTVSFSPVNLTTLSLSPYQTAAAGALSGTNFPSGSNVSVSTSDFTIVGTYTVSGTTSSVVGSAAFTSAAAVAMQNLLLDSPTVAVSVQALAAGGRRSLLQNSATVVVTAAKIGPVLSQAQSINTRLTSSPLVTGQLAATAQQVGGGSVTAAAVSVVATATLAVQVTVPTSSLSFATASINSALTPSGAAASAMATASGTTVTTSSVAVVYLAGPPGPSSGTSSKSYVALGVGLGIGLGGGLILVGVLLYVCVLRKRNIEHGQASAVVMTNVGARS